MGRLDREAHNRPAIAPNADDILAAFAKSGVVFDKPRRGLGATFAARYCLGGTTTDGAITLGICEYPDDVGAAKGADIARNLLHVKTRDVFTHKETMINVIRLRDDAPTRALRDKLQAVYMAL
jgi:hypothetical protein